MIHHLINRVIWPLVRTAHLAARKRNHPLHYIFRAPRQSKRARRRARGRAKGARA